MEDFGNPARPGGLEYDMDQQPGTPDTPLHPPDSEHSPRAGPGSNPAPNAAPNMGHSTATGTARNLGRRAAPTPADIVHTRELFWNNIIREMLSTLATASAMGAPPIGEPGVDRPAHPADVLDGRLAVITREGARIPIAAVTPLFACGVSSDEPSRILSMDVECTVFQIRTPTGEVFTLPLHEIRSFHALTDELMERLRQAARDQSTDEEPSRQEPFGFAAFTSLARARKEALPLEFEPHFTGPYFDSLTRSKRGDTR